MQLKKIAKTVAMAGCIAGAGVPLAEKTEAQEQPDSAEVHYFSWQQSGGDGLQTFNGEEELTIIEPVVVLKKNIGDRWNVTAKADVDIISAASSSAPEIHAASGASGYDRRSQQDLNVTFVPTFDLAGDRTFLGAGLSQSQEYGYQSNGFSMSATQEFLERNLALSLSFNRLVDDIRTYKITPDGISGTRQKITTNWALSGTQLLTRKSLINMTLQLTHQEGYLARSLNSVRVRNAFRQQERLPDTRDRMSLRTQYNAFLGKGSAIHLIHRYYQDDFGVSAHTLQGRVFHELPFNFELGGHLRYHTQTAVKYWKEIFDGNETYATSDSDLEALDSVYGEVSLSWKKEVWDYDLLIKSFAGHYSRSNGLEGNAFGLSVQLLF